MFWSWHWHMVDIEWLKVDEKVRIWRSRPRHREKSSFSELQCLCYLPDVKLGPKHKKMKPLLLSNMMRVIMGISWNQRVSDIPRGSILRGASSNNEWKWKRYIVGHFCSNRGWLRIFSLSPMLGFVSPLGISLGYGPNNTENSLRKWSWSGSQTNSWVFLVMNTIHTSSEPTAEPLIDLESERIEHS